MWGMKYALLPLAAAIALWWQPAQASSLSVCADSGASAGEVAHHCKLSLRNGGLSDRQTVAVYVNLGYAELALGQTGQAVESFTEATRLNPRQVEAYIGRAKAYEDRRAFDAADQDWKSALGLASRSVDVRLGRGAYFLRQARHELALEEFTAALRIDPDEADARYNRGLTWLALDRMEEADRDFTRLLQDYPNDAGAYFNRARARAGRNDRAALADYAKASELSPGWASPWFFAGKLLDKLGREAEANRQFRRAFELGYQDPWLLQRIQKLGG